MFSVKCEGGLDVDLPLKLLVDVVAEVLHEEIQSLVLLSSEIVICFLIQTQVLEPKRTVLFVVLKALIADLEGFPDVVLALLEL